MDENLFWTLAFNNHPSVVRLKWQKSQVKIANWSQKMLSA